MVAPAAGARLLDLPIAASADLIRAIASLISSIAWPLVALLVLLRFGPQLGRWVREKFPNELDRVEVQAGAFRIAMATKELVQAEAEALPAGVAAPEGEEAASAPPRDIAATVTRTAEVVATGSPPEILWVDDRPQNNTRIRSAMENLGMHVT